MADSSDKKQPKIKEGSEAARMIGRYTAAIAKKRDPEPPKDAS
jgi:hypothetical protein